MRVVLLSYRVPPDVGAASARAKSIADALRQAGHEVEMPRLWVPRLRYEGYLRRLLVYLGFLFSCSWWLAWEAPPCDEVVYVSPWALTSLSWPAVLFGRLRGARVVLDVHDAYVEVFPRPVRWLVRLMAEASSRWADEVTLASLSMGDGLPEEKVRLVPLTADPAFRPSGRARTHGRLVVAYSGNLSRRYDFATLLKAASMLPEVEFRIRGSGEMEPFIRRAMGGNVSLSTEALGLDALVRWLDDADVLVCLLVDSEEARRSSAPQKLVEYMAMGKPVICTDVGEAGKAVRAYPKGVAVPPGDAEAVCQAVKYQDRERVRERGA
jgi:glycosyltransferase involved in cell wall biosynthesis